MELLDRNTFSVRYEVLRNGGVYGTVESEDVPEIQCNTESDLILSIKGAFVSDGEYNFLTDRLRPVITLNGAEYPVGIYVVTTEERSEKNGHRIVGIEGYSILYLAKRKKTETRLHINAGENYITVISNLLASAGIDSIEAQPTSYTFATDREDWDIGTSVLDVVNALLEEISYENAYVDLDGRVILKKYTPPSIENVKHLYTEGKKSVIVPEYVLTDDKYNKANVFRLTCDNPDMDAIMVAVAENNSAESPFSTVNIGRVLHNEKVNNVPSQEALQERANAMRDRSLQTTEEIEFLTAIAPTHTPHDVVALKVGDASGIFAETGWRLVMSPGNDMVHTARRIII